MSIHDDNTLDRDLHERAAEAVNERRDADLVARAVELARAAGADDRAWALVRLGADLRALQRYGEALFVLDTAWWVSPSEPAELAIFTCAIAIHCDRGDHEVGVKLERHFADRRVDLKFARACVRLYSELCHEIEDEEYRARRDAYRSLVESLGIEEERPIAA